jgi:hypothetical protein
VVATSVILFDPIFQGLAISLMAGEIASLFISRMAVPVLYFMAHGNGSEPMPTQPRDQLFSIDPEGMPQPASHGIGHQSRSATDEQGLDRRSP